MVRQTPKTGADFLVLSRTFNLSKHCKVFILYQRQTPDNDTKFIIHDMDNKHH
jgi:hypothetical protein